MKIFVPFVEKYFVLKSKIGIVAVALINNVETNLLDLLMTIMEAMKQFPKQNETIKIANTIAIAYSFMAYPKAKIIFTRGILPRNSLLLVVLQYSRKLAY